MSVIVVLAAFAALASATRVATPCSSPYRAFDGSCTNPGPSTCVVLQGAANRPLFSYFGLKNVDKPSGSDLASAREISNVLFAQSASVPDAKGLNQFAVFLAQFVAHDAAQLGLNVAEPYPIAVPDNDPVLSGDKTELAFFRAERAKVKPCVPASAGDSGLPLTFVSGALDLSVVYGSSKFRFNALAKGVEGMLKMGKGDLLPSNGEGKLELPNFPPNQGGKYFAAGDVRANMHPVLTAVHTVFAREHNRIAEDVRGKLGGETDRLVFETARKINVAQYQKIVFGGLVKALTGMDMPVYKGFKKNVNPSASVLFASAAGDLGSMVGESVVRVGEGGKKLESVGGDDVFFLTANKFEQLGLDSFLRGALGVEAERYDTQVVDAARNGFDSVLETDLVAQALQRGRDTALPSYNKVRAEFGMKKAGGFADITKNDKVATLLKEVYGDVDKVEVFAGLHAEDVEEGSLGPLAAKIWMTELQRLRDGDSFFYLRDGAFTEEEMKLDRVKKLFEDGDLLRDIVLSNSGLGEGDLPMDLLFAKL